jgi:2'-5' RNA ligase
MELRPEPVARPERGRPRLFAIEGRSPEVEAIQADVSGRLEAAGFYVPEKRPFWVHLTVARVKPERKEGKRGRRGKPAVVESPPGPLPEQTFASFCPTRLVVFRSTLRPSGAVYEPMAELELPTAETRTER